jgi:hypothetical protein
MTAAASDLLGLSVDEAERRLRVARPQRVA